MYDTAKLFEFSVPSVFWVVVKLLVVPAPYTLKACLAGIVKLPLMFNEPVSSRVLVPPEPNIGPELPLPNLI